MVDAARKSGPKHHMDAGGDAQYRETAALHDGHTLPLIADAFPTINGPTRPVDTWETAGGIEDADAPLTEYDDSSPLGAETGPRCVVESILGASDAATVAVPNHAASVDEPVPTKAKYRLGKRVAAGGMGSVYVARDRDLRRNVALKTLLPSLANDRGALARFVGEAQAASRLEHPNIVPIHELGVGDQGIPFFTMKLVQGECLSHVIKRLADGDAETHADFPLTRRLRILQQICDAIGFAHSRRVLHRDLKPGNVMLGAFGEVVVVDWGLAKQFHERSALFARPSTIPDGPKDSEAALLARPFVHTHRGELLGTPVYMSPEQARGHTDDIDERSDIYGLGAIAYELLGLRPPFQGEALGPLLQAVRNDAPAPLYRLDHPAQGRVPREVSEIVHRALQKAPDERFPTAKAMRDAIEGYMSGTAPVVCYQTFMKRGTSRLARLIDNHPRWVALLLALVTAAAVASPVFFVLYLTK